MNVTIGRNVHLAHIHIHMDYEIGIDADPPITGSQGGGGGAGGAGGSGFDLDGELGVPTGTFDRFRSSLGCVIIVVG